MTPSEEASGIDRSWMMMMMIIITTATTKTHLAVFQSGNGLVWRLKVTKIWLWLLPFVSGIVCTIMSSRVRSVCVVELSITSGANIPALRWQRPIQPGSVLRSSNAKQSSASLVHILHEGLPEDLKRVHLHISTFSVQLASLHRVLSSITFACLFRIISSAMCRRTTSADITFNQWSACSFSDGVGKSGLFSALYYVINRMIYDHDVDAFMAVRHVQTVCPHSVASLVSQICFCFKKSIL